MTKELMPQSHTKAGVGDCTNCGHRKVLNRYWWHNAKRWIPYAGAFCNVRCRKEYHAQTRASNQQTAGLR